MHKEQLKQKYLEFQILSQEIQKIQEQRNLFFAQLEQLKTLLEGLYSLELSKKGTSFLAPLGPGVFALTTLDANDTILMNVGSNVVVSKTIPESLEIVREQIKELETYSLKTEEQLEVALKYASSIQEELDDLTQDLSAK